MQSTVLWTRSASDGDRPSREGGCGKCKPAQGCREQLRDVEKMSFSWFSWYGAGQGAFNTAYFYNPGNWQLTHTTLSMLNKTRARGSSEDHQGPQSCQVV